MEQEKWESEYTRIRGDAAKLNDDELIAKYKESWGNGISGDNVWYHALHDELLARGITPPKPKD